MEWLDLCQHEPTALLIKHRLNQYKPTYLSQSAQKTSSFRSPVVISCEPRLENASGYTDNNLNQSLLNSSFCQSWPLNKYRDSQGFENSKQSFTNRGPPVSCRADDISSSSRYAQGEQSLQNGNWIVHRTFDSSPGLQSLNMPRVPRQLSVSYNNGFHLKFYSNETSPGSSPASVHEQRLNREAGDLHCRYQFNLPQKPQPQPLDSKSPQTPGPFAPTLPPLPPLPPLPLLPPQATTPPIVVAPIIFDRKELPPIYQQPQTPSVPMQATYHNTKATDRKVISSPPYRSTIRNGRTVDETQLQQLHQKDPDDSRNRRWKPIPWDQISPTPWNPDKKVLPSPRGKVYPTPTSLKDLPGSPSSMKSIPKTPAARSGRIRIRSRRPVFANRYQRLDNRFSRSSAMEKHQHEIPLPSEGTSVAEPDSEDESMGFDLEAREEDLNAEVRKHGNTGVMYEQPDDDASMVVSDWEDEGVDLASEPGDLSPGLGSMELVSGKTYRGLPGWLV